MDMKMCLEYKEGKYDILHGRDEILTCGLILGAKGAIGSTYNYMAPLFIQIMEKFKEKDLDTADKLQLKAIEIIRILHKYGGATRAGKTFMRIIGFDFGHPRLPVTKLTPSEEARLQEELDMVRFEKYCLPIASI